MSEFAKGLLIGIAVTTATIWAIILLSGCSTHTIQTTGVNATSTAVLYCPEALVIRIDNGTVTLGAESAGVGTVVQSLGDNAAEVMR